MNINNEDLRHHVHQYNNGLINAIEFLLKVQVSPQAIKNLLIAAKLPAAAQINLDVGDLMQSDDEKIEGQWAASDKAARDVTAKILERLERDETIDEADFKFYIQGSQIGVTAKAEVLMELSRFLIIKNRNTLNELDCLWFERATLEELFPPIPKDFAPTLWVGKRGERTANKSNPNIEYAKELLDWMALEYTSAMLRSFKFYKCFSPTDTRLFGIYTSDTLLRQVLFGAVKNSDLFWSEQPLGLARPGTLWLSEETFAKAENIRPPKDITYEEEKT